MKWENRGINVAKQAKIPKLNKLDGIETLLRHFKFFLDHELANMIVGDTNLYGHRNKGDTNFEIKNETFHS